MLTAEELHRRGISAMSAGRLALATRLLQRALGRATDDAMRARVEASLAYVGMDTNDFATALAALNRALAFPDLPREVRGVLTSQRANVLWRSGKPREAVREYAGAIEALGELPRDLGIALLNRGLAHLALGALGAARADFSAAALAYDRANDPIEAAKARHNLAYVRYREGDLPAALKLLDEQAETLLAAGPLPGVIYREDRAEILFVAGLHHEGATELREVAATYGRMRMPQRQGETLLTLATHLRAYEPAQARKFATQARRRFATLGSEAWRIRAESAVLAAEVDLGGRGEQLVDRADLLVGELMGQGLHWGAASVRLHVARVLVRRGDFEGARRRLSGVRLSGDAPLTIRLLARDARAELEEAQGRRQAALVQIRLGLEELHAWQSSFGSLDLQTMVIGNGIRLAKQALHLAVGSGKPETVFEWSERARMLASRVQPVRAELDEELAADLSELRSLQSSEDGPRVPSPRRARDEELRQRVRERAWRLQGSGEVTEPASLPELVEALGDDTALVAWVATDLADQVTALVVTDVDARVVDLGPRTALDELLDGLVPDLDVAASELPQLLAGVVRAQLADRLAGLGSLLVSPLLELIGSRSLVLTPSGVLAGVPWTLLPGLEGRPLTQARSATRWMQHREGLLRTAGFVAGPRVARAEAEVTEAALCWTGSSTLIGEKATTEQVSELAAEVDVLHVAAHGRHSGDNPLFSGLECVDGPWFGYDIDHLETVPQVVVLSACEVGRSSVRAGDELIGMTAAWLHAGVGCVVASPAAVSDEVAHEVLTAFHRGLADGLTPEAALARAVPAATDDRPPAPFVCFR